MAASSTATATVTLTHSNLKRISPLPVIGIILMFPNPDLVDVDSTFSQVILRVSHCRIDVVSGFILFLNSNIRISLATLNLYYQFVFRV